MEMVKRYPSCAILLICSMLMATAHSIDYDSFVKNIQDKTKEFTSKFVPTPPPANKASPSKSTPSPPKPTPAPPTPTPAPPTPTPAQGQGKKWCVAKPGTLPSLLQSNIDYACSQSGVDCKPIQTNDLCYQQGILYDRASYAMNSYYQAKGKNPFNCDFKGSGLVTDKDPSRDKCKYLA